MKSVCLINNQCDPQSKIDTLNGQKVNITLSKLVEDDAKDNIVEVKSVKYRELITKSQDDSNTDDRGRQIRLHHLMVIKAPPNIHENNMDREAEEVKSDVEEEDARSTSKYTGCTCACPRVCPPRGQVASILTISTILITLWAVSYCVLGEVALPGHHHIYVTIEGGTLFSLLVMFTVSSVAGWLVQIVHLPPLLGMLLTGILLRNVPYIDVAKGVDPEWYAATRTTALVVILLRACLGLNPEVLAQLSGMVFRLAMMPCLMETGAVTLAGHLMLGLPWAWAAMLGFALAAVSPAVVVSCLLSLQERGFGVVKGIPSLVIAAASMDDVLAISCFTILLGITFSSTGSSEDTNMVMLLLHAPLEILVAVVFGLFWGVLVTYLPAQPDPSPAFRLVMLLLGALLAMFGSDVIHLKGAGALAILVMAFTAGVGWRKQGWGEQNPVAEYLANMWIVFQPLLFSLIGAEIQVTNMSLSTVGWGSLVLMVGLTARVMGAFMAVSGGNNNVKEKLFISLAWLPKATVQAALGPVALGKAREVLDAHLALQETPTSCSDQNLSEDLSSLCSMISYGEQILTIAVMAILLTAPLGAAAIMITGPKLLHNDRNRAESIHIERLRSDSIPLP